LQGDFLSLGKIPRKKIVPPRRNEGHEEILGVARAILDKVDCVDSVD
jgi:hypothetical protein